jgi:hypothetical protein
MERRRLMFMGLAGALTATMGLAATAQAVTMQAATAQAGILGDSAGPSHGPMPNGEPEASEGGVQLAQYHSSGRYRRGPRCWNQTRTVRYRDRWGRMRARQVTERVCR